MMVRYAFSSTIDSEIRRNQTLPIGEGSLLLSVPLQLEQSRANTARALPSVEESFHGSGDACVCATPCSSFNGTDNMHHDFKLSVLQIIRRKGVRHEQRRPAQQPSPPRRTRALKYWIENKGLTASQWILLLDLPDAYTLIRHSKKKRKRDVSVV
jgi:hypothetical protein